LPCFGCGYDLRATDPRAACPECGMLVSETLARGMVFEPMASAGTVWAQNMARVYRWLPAYLMTEFALWIVVGGMYGIAVYLVGAYQRQYTYPSQMPADLVLPFQAAILLFMLLRLGVQGFGLYFLWHLGTADPRRSRVPRWDGWRQFARVVFCIFAAVTVIEAVGWMALTFLLPLAKLDDLASVPSIMSILAAVQSYLWLGGGYAGVLGAVELAGRLESEFLKGEAAKVKSIFNIYAILMLVNLGFVMTCCLYCLTCFVAPVAFVLWIVYVVLAGMTYPKIASAIGEHLAQRGPNP
jgi:hypothetical protein